MRRRRTRHTPSSSHGYGGARNAWPAVTAAYACNATGRDIDAPLGRLPDPFTGLWVSRAAAVQRHVYVMPLFAFCELTRRRAARHGGMCRCAPCRPLLWREKGRAHRSLRRRDSTLAARRGVESMRFGATRMAACERVRGGVEIGEADRPPAIG